MAYIKQDVNDSSFLVYYALSLSKQFVAFHVKEQHTRLLDSQIRSNTILPNDGNVDTSTERNIIKKNYHQQHRCENLKISRNSKLDIFQFRLYSHYL